MGAGSEAGEWAEAGLLAASASAVAARNESVRRIVMLFGRCEGAAGLSILGSGCPEAAKEKCPREKCLWLPTTFSPCRSTNHDTMRSMCWLDGPCLVLIGESGMPN